MSGDIVDAIEHTLHDYGTSLDAMRWTPDVPEPEAEPECETCGGPCRWMRAYPVVAEWTWTSPVIFDEGYGGRRE